MLFSLAWVGKGETNSLTRTWALLPTYFLRAGTAHAQVFEQSMAGNGMKYIGVTYKHLRLFVEEEHGGWVAHVYDLDQMQLVHEGQPFHPTAEAAQKEAQSQANLILGETTDIDWSANSVRIADG